MIDAEVGAFIPRRAGKESLEFDYDFAIGDSLDAEFDKGFA